MSFASKLFKNSKNITLEKIAAAPGAVTSPGSWDQWEEGSPHNRGSLPIDYTLQGFLLIPIQIEIPIVLARTHRNRIEKLGYFRSTQSCSSEATISWRHIIRSIESPKPSLRRRKNEYDLAL